MLRGPAKHSHLRALETPPPRHAPASPRVSCASPSWPGGARQYRWTADGAHNDVLLAAATAPALIGAAFTSYNYHRSRGVPAAPPDIYSADAAGVHRRHSRLLWKGAHRVPRRGALPTQVQVSYRV
jgi:hypothetical protein